MTGIGVSRNEAPTDMAKRKGGIPGLSFSWKRAIGLTSAKQKLARDLGVPLTRAGRQRKLGKAAGCCVPFLVLAGSSIATVVGVVRLFA